jgi:tRNA A-37 threonylcarbamoyl transferase component Bud32/tetratricopeptide (TPR) repeat protein
LDAARWQTVKDIFATALEQEAAHRAAYLDQACATDGGLRAEVDSLLEAHDSAEGFIEEPAVERAPGLPLAERTSWIGRRVGVYRIVEEVGRGGMSEVYKAFRDDDEYQKEVAVKVLRTGYATASLQQRLRVEMQILANLDHPHIARLLDGGTSDGLPYLVMDYIRGLPIDEFCRQRQLTIGARLELFRALCSAVQYVHQNLMVHGDLKCGNVLVTASATPRLLDFGIARLLTQSERLPQIIALTPEYASPEQARGEPISTSSDVYSLAMVLSRILDGTNPDVDAILRKALQPAPADRYSSVEQLDADIRRHLEGFPIVARPATLGYQLGRFIRRHTVSFTVATLFVLTLITGIVATAWEAHVAHVQRARAERHFEEVRRLANSFMMDVESAIQKLPGSTPARRVLVTNSLHYLDALSEEAADNPALKRELAMAYEKVADVQGGFRTANLGETQGALASYRKALAIRSALVAADPDNLDLRRELLRTYGKLSDVLTTAGDVAGAVDTSRHVVSLAEGLAARTDTTPAIRIANRRNLGNAYLGLGMQLAKAGDIQHGLDLMGRGAAIYESLVKADPGDLTSRRNLALAYGREGEALLEHTDRYDEAAAMHARTLEIVAALAAADTHNTDLTEIRAYALLGIGGALYKQGRFQRALDRQSEAVGLLQALADADARNEEARQDLAQALEAENQTRSKLR